MSAVKLLLLDPKTVIYLLNLAVAASLVCGLGLLAARVCRHRPAPVSHGILVGTLALLLLSPAAVWLGERSGLTWMELAVSTQADSAEHSEVAMTEPWPGRVSAQSDPAASTGTEALSATGPAHMPSAVGGASTIRKPSLANERPSRGVLDEEYPLPPPTPARPSAVRTWQFIGALLALGWMVGIFVQVIRLAWAYRVLGSFRRCLEEVAEPRLKTLAQQAAAAVGTRDAPMVLCSPLAPAPFCMGVVKPVVVIPEKILKELDDNQLQDILIHETAHLARRDTWVSLAQRMAVILFWWNVLVYRLRDRIADLREDICDNYVCQAQREAARFAQTLVGLAARAATPHFLPATLGIVEPVGLMGRVTRLLNKERNMATRMSLASRVLVVSWTGAVLLAIVSVGGVRVAQSAPAGERQSVEVEVKVRAIVPAAEETTAEELKPNVEVRVIVPAADETTKEEKKSTSESAIQNLRSRLWKGDQTVQATIVGGWQANSLSMALADGTRKTVSKADGALSVILSDKRFTLRAGDKVLTDMSYTLDSKQDPCAIDLTSPDGAMLGFFKFDGDRLWIALNDASQGRPKDIAQQSNGLVLDLVRYEASPLWTINADGTHPRPFYTPPDCAHCGSPAWSPDGSKVTFDCIRRLFGENFPATRIMVVDATGGRPKEVQHGVLPNWSPDGKKIAFCSYEAPHSGVCIMNADGSDVQSIDTQGWGIVWSPKADEVAYTVGGNLCLYDLKTKERRYLLGSQYGSVSFGFTWSPDGQWICFCGETGQDRELAVVHRDGAEKGLRVILSTRTTPGLKVIGGFLAWEPKEGKRIVASLATAENPNRQLFFVDSEGNMPPQRLAGQDPKQSLMSPAWSPDGKRIVFSVRPATPNTPR